MRKFQELWEYHCWFSLFNDENVGFSASASVVRTIFRQHLNLLQSFPPNSDCNWGLKRGWIWIFQAERQSDMTGIVQGSVGFGSFNERSHSPRSDQLECKAEEGVHCRFTNSYEGKRFTGRVKDFDKNRQEVPISPPQLNRGLLGRTLGNLARQWNYLLQINSVWGWGTHKCDHPMHGRSTPLESHGNERAGCVRLLKADKTMSAPTT